jgi:hypothetical protein
MPAPTDPIARGNRGQTPGTAAQRLGGAKNLPADGSRIDQPQASAPSWRAGTGSISPTGAPMGNKPFKFNDAPSSGSAKPAPAPAKASRSDSASKPLATFARKTVPGAGR